MGREWIEMKFIMPDELSYVVMKVVLDMHDKEEQWPISRKDEENKTIYLKKVKSDKEEALGYVDVLQDSLAKVALVQDEEEIAEKIRDASYKLVIRRSFSDNNDVDEFVVERKNRKIIM